MRDPESDVVAGLRLDLGWGLEREGVVRFDELELDSIELAELIVTVEERFGITLTHGDIEGATSITDLVELAERTAGVRPADRGPR